MQRSTGRKSLFDGQFSAEKRSEIGNPLDKISRAVDFEMFRDLLEGKPLNKAKKSNAGTKPFGVAFMSRILILQCYYGLGDKQVGHQILDRTRFKNRLGL